MVMKFDSYESSKRWLKKVLLILDRSLGCYSGCYTGLIYRHYRPVHYSPSSRSALAEAELVYKDDHVSHSVYVTFDIDRKASIQNPVLREIVSSEPQVQLLVWTTTPWTLTANMVSC